MALDVFDDFLTKFPIEEFKRPLNKSNISRNERKALHELRRNKDIVIKQTDKGGAVVIMDGQYYSEKVTEILKNEEICFSLTENIDDKVTQKVKNLTQLYDTKLTEKGIRYLADFDYRTSNFYGLPKVHKSRLIITETLSTKSKLKEVNRPHDLTFRPIVGGPIFPTSHLSYFIDTLIKPLVIHVKSHSRDGIEFLNKLPRNVPMETIMTSFNIVSLYTNIPHDLGVEAIDYWIKEYPDSIPARFFRSFIIT